MTSKEIKAQIRDLKRSMKEQGIRVVSCFNGGLTPDESRHNTRLFELKVNLEKAEKAEKMGA